MRRNNDKIAVNTPKRHEPDANVDAILRHQTYKGRQSPAQSRHRRRTQHRQQRTRKSQSCLRFVHDSERLNAADQSDSTEAKHDGQHRLLRGDDNNNDDM